jgi:hypothetical protein
VLRFADLSVEVGHGYLGDLTPEAITHMAAVESTWLVPVVERYRRHRRTVSVCVLIDDYFERPTSSLSPGEAVKLIQGAYTSRGLAIDHVVSEAACAESVGTLVDRLRPEPQPGDGTQRAPVSKTGWLANGIRAEAPISDRPVAGGRPDLHQADSVERLHPEQFRARQHSIFLDVELWSEPSKSDRLWSCPLLAAWWQLIRLGMLRDSFDVPTVPKGTASGDAVPPLFARRTLTALSPTFLGVEHSVRSILTQVDLPDRWLSALADGPHRQQSTSLHLDRIAYAFIPSGFDAHGVNG